MNSTTKLRVTFHVNVIEELECLASWSRLKYWEGAGISRTGKGRSVNGKYFKTGRRTE